ncbi:nuclear transport factor 2 family protein [Sphingosinicella soli]|uniref:Ketosteroid isomerase-like protein n=1 Tax=Sphingosinicella soli TaxID=333708 RepID=A0A7W7B575_9SPHN|nr:nuclear transport factor 2 family protein [Sphingosinicella soli]MBB4633378.1 ketosteroid isomerase-like protein [Sphingosinicella soli]
MSSLHQPHSTDEVLLREFVRCFVEDDPTSLLAMLSPDCEWTVMPTGERFDGLSEIAGLMDKVQQARTHSSEARLEIRDAFVGDGHLCIEFLHRGVIAAGFGGGASDVASGTIFEIDFCATALLRDGKIVRVREYFDHMQLTTPPGQRPRFFS